MEQQRRQPHADLRAILDTMDRRIDEARERRLSDEAPEGTPPTAAAEDDATRPAATSRPSYYSYIDDQRGNTGDPDRDFGGQGGSAGHVAKRLKARPRARPIDREARPSPPGWRSGTG